MRIDVRMMVAQGNIDMNVHALAAELKQPILNVTELAGCKLSAEDIEVQWLPAPHRPPSSLPLNKQGIYCFFYGSSCLKVGSWPAVQRSIHQPALRGQCPKYAAQIDH